MARKKKADDGHAGGHGWFVTFADLMGLLMSFFVMIAAYSTMDKQKMQKLMGSMKDAFGVQMEDAYDGIVELDGFPSRTSLRNVQPDPSDNDRTRPIGEPLPVEHETGKHVVKDRKLALAAASLRQALQDSPEINEISKQVIFQETDQGLNIELVDQDGRSMFPEYSKDPYERTRRLIVALSRPLVKAGFRIQIVGHTAADRVPMSSSYGAWNLTSDRANAVRAILEAEGMKSHQFALVGGKADTDPLLPDDPYMAANRRVSILLMKEEPVVPLGLGTPKSQK